MVHLTLTDATAHTEILTGLADGHAYTHQWGYEFQPADRVR